MMNPRDQVGSTREEVCSVDLFLFIAWLVGMAVAHGHTISGGKTCFLAQYIGISEVLSGEDEVDLKF